MLAPTHRAAPVMSAAWPVSASRAGRTGTEADMSCVMGPDYDRIGDTLNPAAPVAGGGAPQPRGRRADSRRAGGRGRLAVLRALHGAGAVRADRKSTRLNSSHSQISYAVFCLKKKKNRHGYIDR